MARESGTLPGVGIVRVRRVAANDWSVYRDVRLAALKDTPEAFSSTLERELGFDERTWRDRIGSAASLLAWCDDAAVGTVTVLDYHESHNHGFAGAAHLVAMWVSPAVRRLGVGRQLVRAALDHARSAGAPAVVLWVFENNARARGLYEQMGFRATDLRDSRPGEPEDIEFLMISELRGSEP